MSKQLSFLLSKTFLTILIFMGSVPVIWQAGVEFEGRWFPVAVRMTDTDPDSETYGEKLPLIYAQLPSESPEEAYVDIFVQFEKIRPCEFYRPDKIETGSFSIFENPAASLTWFSPSGQRLLVEFEPVSVLLPSTRPKGKQVAGPWRIYGVRSLDNTHAILAHRCHPFWITYTPFFP